MRKKNKMLIEAVKKANNIAIGGHIRPDGDCVGACIGLYLYLKEMFPEKELKVYLEEIPNTLKFMKGTEHICHEIPEGKVYDLFIALDCGDMDRLGFSRPLFEKAKATFCVDHHLSNQAFADENVILPDASSTSELIYDLLAYEKISKEVAECLYTGMVHDTGVFRYTCTHPSTMRAAAALMEKDINFSTIITKTFDEKTYVQNQVLGKCLMESELMLDGKCIFSSLSKEEMEHYQVLPKHLDGIVSQLKLTKGVDVSIFAYELEKGTFKVSLRSTEAVDVSVIAGIFNGGGHARAAGCTLKGEIKEQVQAVLSEIQKQLVDGSEK